jgi:hypothetical protein
MNRLKKFFILPITSFAIITFMSLGAQPAFASFSSGNIIDDNHFEDSSSMSAAQIDTLLNSFPSSCISTNNGFNTPDPQGWSDSQSKYTFGGNVTGGVAIYHVAQIYHVNPKVIMTTLQKEQSVVTGSKGCHYDKPNPADSSQLYTCTIGGRSTTCTDACPFSYGGGCMNIAMSYGCPGSCKAADEGFSLQLTLGTWLLRFAQQRAYGNLTGYIGHETGDEFFCYSGPMTAGVRQRSASSNPCPTGSSPAGNTPISYDGTYVPGDSSTITVSNGATATLYNFTPFVSGNQSFYNLWNSTFNFGPLVGPDYAWSYQGQGVYTDNTKSTYVDAYSQALTPNTRYYFTLTALNSGNKTWTQGQVKIGNDQGSILYDPSWLSPIRPATMLESTVSPGQTAHFEFWAKTPNSLYSGRQYFGLVVEGVTWMNDLGLNWPLNTPSFSWQYQGQGVYSDSSKAAYVDSYGQALSPNTRYYYTLAAKNTGNVTWKQGDVRLGTASQLNRTSQLYDSSWLSNIRPATLVESSVAPGQTGHFEFWGTTPSGVFSGNEYFNLLDENLIWFNDLGQNWVVNSP